VHFVKKKKKKCIKTKKHKKRILYVQIEKNFLINFFIMNSR